MRQISLVALVALSIAGMCMAGAQDVQPQWLGLSHSVVPISDELILSPLGANGVSPSVAMLPSGALYVAWSDHVSGDHDVWGQRFTADGIPHADRFKVHPESASNEHNPCIAARHQGDLVVVWEGDDGSNGGIFVTVIRADGQVVIPMTIVNTFTFSSQFAPDVAVAPDGAFVVTWSSYNQDGSSTSTHARRFWADGQPQGEELQVNTTTVGGQNSSVVGMTEDKRCVVCWVDSSDAARSRLRMQRISPDGALEGNEQPVSTGEGHSTSPDIGVSARGNFTVAWDYAALNGSSFFIRARTFTAEGMPLSPVEIDVHAGSGFGRPKVSARPNGDYVVVWQEGYSAGQTRIRGQLVAADGTLAGEVFEIDVDAPDRLLERPNVAIKPNGRLIVTWIEHTYTGVAGTSVVLGRLYQGKFFQKDGFESAGTHLWNLSVVGELSSF